jgi:predicted DNA-binding protein with PD1-like motif
MRQITRRFKDGEDLRGAIERIAKEHAIKAGVIVSVVGSLSHVHLRMAGAKISKEWDGEFEIVSGTGTVSMSDIHVHLSVADVNGAVVGGHLKKGCAVRTTVELVVLAFDDVTYRYEPDEKTGFTELVVE